MKFLKPLQPLQQDATLLLVILLSTWVSLNGAYVLHLWIGSIMVDSSPQVTAQE